MIFWQSYNLACAVLRRQAKRTQEYDHMKADLKIVLREWYGYHWHKAQADLVEAQINSKKQEEALSWYKMHSSNLIKN